MKNPFHNNHRYRLQLAYDFVPQKARSLLDLGCGNGIFLSQISKKLPHTRLYGVEVDNTKIEILKRRLPKVRIFRSLQNTDRLPFKSGTIDVVCLLDVLEHVPSDKATLSVIHKVLKPGGLLLLSVPHRGLTEAFDPGNLKFRSPAIHKFLYKRVFGQGGYEQRYIEGELTGDVSRQKKMWHRHYSLDELRRLLKSKYRIERICHYSLLFPILSMLDQAIVWFTGKDSNFIRKLILLDSRIDYGRFSFSIFISASKI